ncbi:MAG: metallophosphoesterase [Acidobacteriota bacterium]|nr:metallophosphoesterase [Acidobacteriota bacterium]
MPRILAMADLHLSLDGSKPMDRFGDLWIDHARRMAEYWDDAVTAEDTVLLAGDLSWARNLSRASADLDWIGQRPGHKILLKGNHDSWWGGIGKLRETLPASCEALHNDAIEVGPWGVVGARGWLAPDDPIATTADARVWHREIERLQASIADARKRFDATRPLIAMLHYPPWLLGREPTELFTLLEQAGVSICVYGHLHGDDHRYAVRGVHRSMEFHFVAVDAIGFAPVPLVHYDEAT